jgi:transposase-like protein
MRACGFLGERRAHSWVGNRSHILAPAPSPAWVGSGDRTMARPSKLTSAVQEAICDALSAGSSLAEAASKSGIAPSTVFEWLARGRGEDRRPTRRRYAAFAYAVAAAQAPPGTSRQDAGEGFAEFAEPEFSDAPQKSARAREQEASGSVSQNPRAWVSQRKAERALSFEAQDYDF